jgi:hypothetical protein
LLSLIQRKVFIALKSPEVAGIVRLMPILGG